VCLNNDRDSQGVLKKILKLLYILLNQHGFRKAHSTTTACLEIQSTLASLLDKGSPCVMYSADLSAAFDVIRPDIFHQKAKSLIGITLTDLIFEFITNRTGYIDVNGCSSTFFKFPAGCPQGSTLGPRVFNIYTSDLGECIIDNNTWLTTYADDSYVVVTCENQNLTQKVETVVKKHFSWLRSNGLVCNEDKTEMMTLGCDKVNINLNGKIISSTDKMKVLGLIFDSKLDWTDQVSSTISKSSRILHGLKHVRRLFKADQFKRIITSFFFSVFNYGMEVWYHGNLGFHNKRRVRALHYRALRLIYGKTMPKEELNKQRAPPDKMALFMTAKQMINIMNNKQPQTLFTRLDKNAYIERRNPWRFQFFDNSRSRVGKQAVKNRLAMIARHTKFDWAIAVSKDAIRTGLKKSFFI